MKIIFLILILILTLSLKSNTFIDTVYSFTAGTGMNTGQSSEYFPTNIFGPPSTIATKYIAETRPEEILSLGLGGEIVVGLKNNIIINQPGIDFIIFENCFINQFTNKEFAEPAKVSVSANGIDFIEFPFNIDSLTGLAGVTPTIGSQNPFNYPACGGNGFDLEDIGLDTINYIKITDVSQEILNNKNHKNYDPTISGFDLDAVAILHHSEIITSVNFNKLSDKPKYYDIFGNEINDINNYYGYYFKLINNRIIKYVKTN